MSVRKILNAASSTSIVSGDAYWSYVSLLLTGDDLLDHSGNAKTVTNTGTVTSDTTTKKYGTGSLFFNGTSNYLSLPVTSDFDFGSGDYTIECWIKTTNTTLRSIFSIRPAASGPQIITASGGILEFWPSGSYSSDVSRTSTSVCDGVWHHVAAVYRSGSAQLYVDGIGMNVTNPSLVLSGQSYINVGIDQWTGTPDRYWDGYIDDLRVTKGYARYTSNFTPPTAALPTSSATVSTFASPYVDDVFSSYLYTGNGATQNINNGIDLTGQGGMVWIKSRSVTGSAQSATYIPQNNHFIFDTIRTNQNVLNSASTYGNDSSWGSGYFNFNNTGFNLGTSANTYSNPASTNFLSWTFRKAAKFFDIVSYSGNSVQNRVLSHNLGISPGLVIIKCTNASSTRWLVWHRSLGPTPDTPSNKLLFLDGTDGATTANNIFYLGTGTVSSTQFGGLGPYDTSNLTGNSYIAYMFAHDTSSTGLVQCGTFTSTYPSATAVTLGWEPQWLMVKRMDGAESWWIVDNMRGFSAKTSSTISVAANLPDAESVWGSMFSPTATGFECAIGVAGATYCYVAIRRSNKPPTSGNQVFLPVARKTGTSPVVTNFNVDLLVSVYRDSASGFYWSDRLRGGSNRLTSFDGSIENTLSTTYFQSNIGYSPNTTKLSDGASASWFYSAGGTVSAVDYAFKRAPGFLDIVCYSGTGARTSIKHNLTVVPELIIVKSRTDVTNWIAWDKSQAAGGYIHPNLTQGYNIFTEYFYQVPDASYFYIGFDTTYQATNNKIGSTYVAYLFATLAGVSKVGSYTGNGTNQTINCGFSTGARFIMVKCSSSVGDWYVWDSARGIIATNDPHLSLNTTAAEVTTDDSVDPVTTGFIVNQNATTNINASSTTYIYLAIA